ncbi:hypothetical protein ONS95_008331 [Cadophora gregata]|uniref:uncharacterized protein n=1 Tax=Cadophora gregata TaxID=51156 RepID=UPI0026DC793F|nr:uncharacterized protein ONS95_008331 [Cadophora gregata]KAK0100377.1 hypothetical protein ONS96_007657 [Cadophora gregata f. sp. sojae]KAK0126751.1 hypothetical protein ONS95_008331 [Cadophora gregata]
MGKVGMSDLTKELAIDWVREGKKDMAITSIWPVPSIQSGATGQITSVDPNVINDPRRATIYSDAILAMLKAPADQVNGLLELDEDYLRRYCGVQDFSKYSVVNGAVRRRVIPAKFPVLEIAEQDDEGRRTDSLKLRGFEL